LITLADPAGHLFSNGDEVNIHHEAPLKLST